MCLYKLQLIEYISSELNPSQTQVKWCEIICCNPMPRQGAGARISAKTN